MPRPDFTEVRESEKRKEKNKWKVLTQPAFFAISSRFSLLAGISVVSTTRVGVEGVRKLLSFCEPARTFSPVLPARETREHCVLLWKQPLIRSRDPPPLPLLLNCRCSSLSLSLSLSRYFSLLFLSPSPASHFVSLRFSLFPIPFLSFVSYLSQNSISDLSHCLPFFIFVHCFFFLVNSVWCSLLVRKIPSPRSCRPRHTLNFGELQAVPQWWRELANRQFLQIQEWVSLISSLHVSCKILHLTETLLMPSRVFSQFKIYAPIFRDGPILLFPSARFSLYRK